MPATLTVQQGRRGGGEGQSEHELRERSGVWLFAQPL